MQRLARLLFWTALLVAFVMATMQHPPFDAADFHVSDKIQHIVAFATLAGLATWAYPNQGPVTIFLGLALFGGFIELVQSIPAVHRDADVQDWMADMLAVVFIIIIVGLLRVARTRRLERF